MSAYSTLIINDSPFAYYRFGEASGTSAADTSGNGYTATISNSGITYSQTGAISGDPNTAFLFDGAAGKVTCPAGVSAVGWGQITVEAWVKLTSNSFAHNATVWASGNTPNNTGDGFKFWIGNNGTNGGFAVGVSGNKWSQALFSQTFTLGIWYHIAGTWDGTTIRLYVNGVLNGSTGTVSGSIDSTGFAVTIGQDPQAGAQWFPGTMDEPAIYSARLSAAKLQAHYAGGLAQIAPALPQPSFITNAPGNVLLLINDVWYPTIRSDTISIASTVADPIPTFTFDLQDDPSHIPLSELMEVVFIDAGQITQPTHNILVNSNLNPYTTFWSTQGASGVTFSQAGGGGVTMTFANAGNGAQVWLTQTTIPAVLTVGQSYMYSVYVQGSSTPTAIYAAIQVNFLDVNTNFLSTSAYFSGPQPVSTSLVRYSVPIPPIPPNVAYLQCRLLGQTTSATNSGAITFTQPQVEPMCFTTGTYQLSYPTPYCGGGITNCFLMPDSTSVRQMRLFGGLITKATAGGYVGNFRRWTVTVSGYAWYLQKQILNATWTATNDSAVIAAIVTQYFSSVFSTAQVATGGVVTLTYAYNGTARDAFDAMAAAVNFIYYIDAYRTIWYQPPGYSTLAFALSDEPDGLTSFSYYNFSRDFDATQLANIVFVGGATGIAWVEFDAQSIAIYANKTNTSGQYWRTVSDSTITSQAAATQRAIGETAQYNYARPIIHLTTDQFMIPGYTVLFTSSTDGLSQAVFIVQKATLILSGFKSLFKAVYQCQCDLGYFNPDLTNVLSKVLRRQVANTNAAGPAFYGPIPALTVGIGVMATEQMGFRDTVQLTVTSTATIGGVPITWYGTAGATYGNSLVGYGSGNNSPTVLYGAANAIYGNTLVDYG